MKENGLKGMSAKQKMEIASVYDADLSKETLRDWMVKDIRGVHVLLSEVLGSEECISALTEVFYKRYLELQESKKAQPSLEFETKEG